MNVRLSWTNRSPRLGRRDAADFAGAFDTAWQNSKNHVPPSTKNSCVCESPNTICAQDGRFFLLLGFLQLLAL